jgi:hypothetical protein
MEKDATGRFDAQLEKLSANILLFAVSSIGLRRGLSLWLTLCL